MSLTSSLTMPAALPKALTTDFSVAASTMLTKPQFPGNNSHPYSKPKSTCSSCLPRSNRPANVYLRPR